VDALGPLRTSVRGPHARRPGHVRRGGEADLLSPPTGRPGRYYGSPLGRHDVAGRRNPESTWWSDTPFGVHRPGTPSPTVARSPWLQPSAIQPGWAAPGGRSVRGPNRYLGRLGGPGNGP